MSLSRKSVKHSPRYKDHRPLQDKDWQEEAKKDIVNFFAAHKADVQVSLKILSGPKQKEFFSIVSYLIGRLEPKFAKTLNNDSQDIDFLISCLKGRKYPYVPTKQAFGYVASPAHWPPMLGMLHFLVKLCERSEESEKRMALEARCPVCSHFRFFVQLSTTMSV